MNKFEKAPQQESKKFKALIGTIKSVVDELPLAYKRIAMYPDWQLLMGGGQGWNGCIFLGGYF